MTTDRRKIGIMGGTFDPIHIGHLILGEAAYEQYQLEKVLFMPAGNPPHKRERKGRAGDRERAEMVQLAIESNPHFELSLMEMQKNGFTYTYHTLEDLRSKNPDTEYYFIIGADALRDFDQWREPQRILQACHLVVAIRDWMSEESFDGLIARRREEFQGDVRKLNTPNLDVSSHYIRQMLQEGRTVRYFLPDSVLEYIEKHQIYRQREE